MAVPGRDESLFGDAVELYVITGYSGAGKSEAIAAFEDSGYFCVDNLPPRMIAALGELFARGASNVRRAAVVTDARGGDFFDELLGVLDELGREGLKPTLVFLEADDQALVNRFKETRRRHPLAPDGRIVEGIRAERELLAPLRERADVVIDSSGLTGAMLRRRISADLLGPGRDTRLALTLLTFGFKNGPPRDADLVFDVRFLPNPHYREDLRPLTGRDQAVVDHVEAGELASEYYRRLLPLARLPAARLHRRGQDAPDDRDRLHGRAPPLGHGGRTHRPPPRDARRRQRARGAPRRGAGLAPKDTTGAHRARNPGSRTPRVT